MVLSELIANAGLIDEHDAAALGEGWIGMKTVSGLALVKGLAMGHAVYHQPRVTIVQVMAEDITAERQRVYQAFDRRSEERRVGKECVSTCRSLWLPYP